MGEAKSSQIDRPPSRESSWTNRSSPGYSRPEMSHQHDSYPEPEFSSQVSEARYFHLNCSQIADPRLVVICGGRETCAPDYSIDRVTFPYYGIEWVERGQGEVWQDGQRFPLVPSSVFCYGPGISYR